MTDYNDGKWHGWNGGECPVHPESKVEVVLYGASPADWDFAGQYYWKHNSAISTDSIVAFRVTKPYVEPRKPQEFWVNVYEDGSLGCWHGTKEKAIASGSNHRRHRTAKFREVIGE